MARKKIDLTGQRFGKWTVLREAEERTKDGKTQWECLCDCGNKKIVRVSNLRSGSSKSCGCLRAPDITGQRFGKWTVLREAEERSKNGKTQWECSCECGHTSVVLGSNLTTGTSRSCGCLRKESDKLRKVPQFEKKLSKKTDLTGQRFGKWTVLRDSEERDKHRSILWECLCDCGHIGLIRGGSLRSGKSNKCIHCLALQRKTSLIGQRIGKLVVVKEHEERIKGRVYWECVCDCGEEKIIPSHSLRTGNTKSCGCSRYEDFTGQKFGKLTILNVTKQRMGGSPMWQYKCECGKDGYISAESLKKGAKSCGCITTMRDISGVSFGKLTAIKPTNERSGSSIVWLCKCECGKPHSASVGNLSSGNVTSCGCAVQRGKNHWKYDPSIPDEVRSKRRYDLEGNSHIKYSRKIYERDDFTCQLCNERGGKLNAHHLNGWDNFEAERYDLSNGITLCTECHGTFHNYYGRGNNTLDQFRDHLVTMLGEEYFDEVNSYFNNLEPQLLETRELQTT